METETIELIKRYNERECRLAAFGASKAASDLDNDAAYLFTNQ